MIASAKKIIILRFFLSLLKKILNFFIYLIFKIKSNKFSVIISEAFYSPWLFDQDFNNYYEKIKKFTMLDRLRLYNIWSLIKNVQEKEGIVLEVGTWRGGSAMLMGHRLLDLNMSNKLYAMDTFSGVVKSSEKDEYYKNSEHSDCNFNEVFNEINSQNLSNIKLMEGVFPDALEKNNEILNQKILFAHIDVDTYKSAKDILDYIWQAMKSGGIIIFDDYGFHQTNGIRECLDEFILKNKCYSHYLITGQFLLIKL